MATDASMSAAAADLDQGGAKPSPHPTRVDCRRTSQDSFADQLHTTLILDWDDTIFPTTWIQNDCGLNWRVPIDEQVAGQRRTFIKAQLSKLSAQLEVFFEKACASAQVVIVTLAKPPWVETVAKNFLPKVWTLVMEKYKLRVAYAQDGITEEMKREYAKDEFKSDEQVMSFWTRTKSAAIAKEIEANSQRYGGQSWKNIISFGDSDFERYGTMEATQQYMRSFLKPSEIEEGAPTLEGVDSEGHYRRVRTKTVKMLDEPTIEELVAQITLLARWLEPVVRKDEGFDIEFTTSDSDTVLNDLHYQVTGERDNLKWAELAGISG